MKIHFKTALFILVIFTFFISCMTREYDVSEFKEPFREKKTWTNVSEKAVSESASEKKAFSPDAIQTEWWKNFQEPYLNHLIQAAVAGSHDLQIVFKRIRESGISLAQNRSGKFPNVSFNGSSNYMMQAFEEPDFLASMSPTEPGVWEERIKIRNSQYTNVGMVLNWELDIWGKKKQGYLAAINDYVESKALYRAEYLKLISEVALTYFDIRKKDSESQINRELLKNNKQKLIAYQRQFAEGIIPEWQASRQKAEIDNAERELLEIQRIRKQSENRLAVLLGKPPGDFFVPETDSRHLPKIVSVPTGLPSDLLYRRPDIIASSYRVKKAFHRRGESLAARFPSISLTGNAGYASSSLSNFLKQWALGFTPFVSWPIFDGASVKARIDSSEVHLRIAEDEFRRTVIKSFEEVENALINIENRSRQKVILEQKAADLRKIHDQTLAKFEMGLLSQLELLDIVRELHLTETSIIATHYLLLDDTVTLYKALGGGW